MKILILIRSWNRGGAERQCALTTNELARRGHEVLAISVYPGGAFKAMAAASGAETVDLGRRGRFDLMSPLRRLFELVRAFEPDVVYSFMPLANILAVVARSRCRSAACVWGVRASKMNTIASPISKLNLWVEEQCMDMPDMIICNSEASRRELMLRGHQRAIVIENGIDTASFRPDEDARARVRTELGVAEADKLVGIVGRLDPVKDHATFLEASGLLKDALPHSKFLVVGGGAGSFREELQKLAFRLGIGERVVWLDATDNVAPIYSSLDLIVSSSLREGFPNVVAEAMASGVPALVTDVGDSARLVGETGVVVTPRCPAALAQGMRTMLSHNSTFSGEAARARVVSEFSVAACVSRTEEALSTAVSLRVERSGEASRARNRSVNHEVV